MTEKVAVYARISEDVLGLEKGVERQLREARDLVEHRGWTITAEYADNDISALHGAHRPRYQALLDAAQRGEFTRVVAYQLSRLWRNRRERAEAIELLSRRRVSITLIKGNDIDLTTPMGRSFAAQMGEADTLESELKSERVASAALERAQAGLGSGHVLYGWRRVNEFGRGGKRLSFHDELDPEQAAIVRDIVERLLARESLTKIAADLNQRKIPPPRMAAGREPTRGRPEFWSSSSVRSIAMRWANCGKRVHHRGRDDEQLLPAAWPPIVTEAQQTELRTLLSDPARATSKSGARQHYLTFAPDIARCGKCKGRLRVVRKSGHPTYVCSPQGCTGRRKEWVDDLVKRVVLRRLAEPDARDLFRRDDSAAQHVRDEIREIEGKLLELADDHDADLITREQFLRSTARHRGRLSELEKQVEKSDPGLPVSMVADIVGPNAEECWDRLQPAQRRSLLAAMGFELELAYGTRGGPGFKPESVKIRFVRDGSAEV
ncbi:MAG TPA: recombinase family protein [Actinophytocola sp.]|uniref:recombinase family protein n=1 Tax=Actinophytocola sp. TaxID=1872138 RepID=UPI002DB71F21|nr:recombinase family protein [Actinophytocola sp.]HEU5475186.1 recombinase family protein [Actinophytocola sp.]